VVVDEEGCGMSDQSALLNGEILSPDGDHVAQIAEVARAVVRELYGAVPGPAAALFVLCMAMVMIDKNENANKHSDDEFISEITKTLRMLCAEGSV
jgi:hypothetical protein